MKRFYIILFFIVSRVYADVVDGTIANYILTNRIYGIADNISKVSDTHTTNVSTNCGGQFIRADPDITNGVAGLTFYFTNGIKNWGNATDIFILFIDQTNSGGNPDLPWELWFENLSGNKITNIKIPPAKTNYFVLCVKISSSAEPGSWAEFKLVAKSSNAMKGYNTTIYTGENNNIYGGPTNGGLGTGDKGPGYIIIFSNSTPDVKNNEFLRITVVRISNYYINDSSTSGDIWCSAVGNDANDGISPSTPKNTLTNLLNTYKLRPGDTVFIDTGVYYQSFKITPDDSGDSTGYILFKGAGTNNTIFNSTNFNYGIKLTNVSFIKLLSFDIKNANNQNLYFDYTANCIASNIKLYNSKGDGFFLYDSDNNRIEKIYINQCTNYGINFFHSCDTNRIFQCRIYNCINGLWIRNSSYNSIVNNICNNNEGNGMFITNSGHTFLSNNEVSYNGGDGINIPGGDNETLYNNICLNNQKDGITLYYLNNDWADNNLIKKNISIKNGSDGLHINGNNNQIISNTFATNNENGIDHYGATNQILCNEIYSNHKRGIELGGASGVVISNNKIYQNGSDGIGCAGKDNTKFLNNQIHHNHACGISLWWDPTYWGCDNHIIKYNEIYGNNSDGLYIDGNNNYIISNSFYSNNNGVVMKGDIFTNMFNLIFHNNNDGIYADSLNSTLIRNCTLFGNGGNGIKIVNTTEVTVRNCISVSNKNGYTNFSSLTYSLAWGNSELNYSGTPGTGCITNNPYFQSTNPSDTNFLYLSGNEPSPAINAGDPSDPVPPGGGTRIDMGRYEYIIQPTHINITKFIDNISLGASPSSPIPGSCIKYRIHYSNTGDVAENVLVYDKIPVEYVTYVSNSWTNTEPGWIVEFSTNSSPSQMWNSSDYSTNEPSGYMVKWIRWKKPVLGKNKTGDLYFSVIIK